MSSEIKLAQLPYARDLNLIFNYCRLVFPDFPHGICQDSSRLASKVIPDLQEVAGFISSMPYDGKFDWHAWNYDSKKRLFVDLTARQFNDELPDILVVPQNDERFVLNRDNTIHTRQLDLGYCEKSFLRDYHTYAKNPERFSMVGKRKIISYATSSSPELTLPIL